MSLSSDIREIESPQGKFRKQDVFKQMSVELKLDLDAGNSI